MMKDMLVERPTFFGIVIPGLERRLTIGFNRPLRVTVGNLETMGEFRYNKILTQDLGMSSSNEVTLSSPCQPEGKGTSLFREEINDACIDVLEGASQRPAFYSLLPSWRVFWR